MSAAGAGAVSAAAAWARRAAALAAAAAFAVLVSCALAAPAAAAPSAQGFTWPLRAEFDLWQEFSGSHGGIDIGGMPMGEDVLAAKDGQVKWVQTGYGRDPGATSMAAFGNLVILYHPADRTVTYYAHLSAVDVEAGQSVRAGQVIGHVGNSGQTFGATGIHLHFEVRTGGAPGIGYTYAEVGERVDPLDYVSAANAASPRACVLGFADVYEDDWVYSQGWLAYVLDRGLMAGSGGTFRPAAPLSRAQAAAVLWRMVGCPAGSGMGFDDLPEGHYASEAARWLRSIGVVSGYEDESGLYFRPDAPVTREQLAKMMHELEQYLYEVELGSDCAALDGFADAPACTWSREHVGWCVDAGIISGSNGLLMPRSAVTRAQAAKMLAVLDRLPAW